MTSAPLPDDAPEVAAAGDLAAERDAWRARALEAEQIAEQLAFELAGLRSPDTETEPDDTFLDQFGSAPTSVRGFAADGSDPKVVALVLAAVGVVAAMVTVLSVVNNGILSLFTVLMLAITVALAWAATRTRVVRPKVTVVKHTVLVEYRGETYRFDLRAESTQLEVVGKPDEAGWSVLFLRHGRDPLVVDADAVDPYVFMQQLRAFRPDL